MDDGVSPVVPRLEAWDLRKGEGATEKMGEVGSPRLSLLSRHAAS
jgi:hypothetical protein